MYAKAYTGLTLLYVSGEEGFMLKKKEYVKELVSEVEVIYKHTERNERMKVSIVHKNSVE